MRLLAGVGCALAAFVLAVVFLWPGPGGGPEPIRWGRDACAHCRMHLARPGFAGELRDARGRLSVYDDVGCLLRAMLASHAEMPEAWVEDHEGGGFVPLVAASLVRAADGDTPMGSGLLAFADEGAARGYATTHGGTLVRLEDVLHERTWLARAGAEGEGEGR